MKKVLITHITNTLNYGSAMMAINLIYGIRQYFFEDKLEIYCECDEYHLNRLKIATGISSLKKYSAPIEKSSNVFGKINKFIIGNSKIIQSIKKKFDVLIVLGGDDLAETNVVGAMKFGVLYYHINQNCKVILAGQSIGPFHGIYKQIASFLFKDIVLVTRDDNSYDFSKQHLHIHNVFKSRDLALSKLPKQEQFNIVINEKNLKNKKYIVVVPSGLIQEYTQDKDGYFNTWKMIIENLINDYPDHFIIMLGHVLLPERVSDATTINYIYNKINDGMKNNIIQITDKIQPAEARAILGASDFVITGRMHAAVSALYMNVPAIALAYSEKYNGVIRRGLNLDELIVDCRGIQWGVNSVIIENVMHKVKFINQNYISLKEKISKNVFENSNMVEEQIKFIVNEIGNN